MRKCQYVVVSPDQPSQQCGKDAEAPVYQTTLCQRHLEVINRGNWLSPSEVKAQP